MDSRDGKKKKESIDDILSDLNGLLNKMPSILDGIKMPEPQPAERAPEPARQEYKAPPPAAEAEKTVVLQPFSGLPEGAPAPEKISEPAAPAFDADKTVVLESFSGLSEGAAVPELKNEEPAAAPAGDKIVLQSLGDFMFGADAEKNAPPPAAEIPAAAVEAPVEAQQEPDLGSVFPGLPAEPADAINLAPLGLPEGEPSSKQYDTTRDFGIPDIDALMQLSGSDQPAADSAQLAEEPAVPAAAEESPAQEQPEEPAQPAEPLEQASLSPAADPGEPVPTGDELAEFEAQLKAAAPQQGENVENNKPEEEKTEISLQAEEQPAQAAGPEAFIIEPEPSKPTGFEAFTIEPETPEQAPAQDAGETLSLEPAAEAAPAEPPVVEGLELSVGAQPEAAQPAAEPVIEVAQGISLGAQPDLAAETLQVPPAAEPAIGGSAEFSLGAQPDQAGETLQTPPQAEPELTVGNQGGGSPQFGIPAPQGIELEPTSAMFSPQPAAAASGPSGDETLVIAPPSGASGDDEKTVIFQAGEVPGVTSRSQAGDLAGLAGRPVPEGIPAERVKGLVFLYAPEDKALCATVMAELDAICLKSATKPMFVKRSLVRECEGDLNANVALQMVQDNGAIGLVCVGTVPQEKIYEMENTFSGGGGFFRYYDSASFNHSAALDLVTDLILR